MNTLYTAFQIGEQAVDSAVYKPLDPVSPTIIRNVYYILIFLQEIVQAKFQQ